MARVRHPVHDLLVDRLALQSASLCDLGCGSGGTLVAAASAPSLRLAGIDRDARAVSDAFANLDGSDVDLVVGELSERLPWADATFDRVVCHNVLECLIDPADLIEEAGRVLVSGGIAVWSHIDFAGFIVAADDEMGNRAVLDAYAYLPQPWMDHAEPRMGRLLPGLIASSSLDVTAVEVHNRVFTEMAGDDEARVLEIDHALRTAQEPRLGEAAIDAWRADLDGRAATGGFFFTEPTVIVTSRKAT